MLSQYQQAQQPQGTVVGTSINTVQQQLPLVTQWAIPDSFAAGSNNTQSVSNPFHVGDGMAAVASRRRPRSNLDSVSNPQLLPLSSAMEYDFGARNENRKRKTGSLIQKEDDSSPIERVPKRRQNHAGKRMTPQDKEEKEDTGMHDAPPSAAPLQYVNDVNSVYDKIESWNDIRAQVGNVQSVFDALTVYQATLIQENANEKDKLRVKLTNLKIAFAEAKTKSEARSNVLQAIYNELAQHSIPTIDLLDSQYTQSAIDVEVVLNFIRESQCAPPQALTEVEALLLEYKRDVYMLETTSVSAQKAREASHEDNFDWERVVLPGISQTPSDEDGHDIACGTDAEALSRADMSQLMKIARRYSRNEDENGFELSNRVSQDDEEQHRVFLRASMEQVRRVLHVKEKWIALRSKVAHLRGLCLEALTSKLMSYVSTYALKADIEVPAEFQAVFAQLSEFADVQSVYKQKRNDVLTRMRSLINKVISAVRAIDDLDSKLRDAIWPSSYQQPNGFSGSPDNAEYATRVTEEFPLINYYMPATAARTSLASESSIQSSCKVTPIVLTNYQKFGGDLMGPDTPQQSLFVCAEPGAGKTFIAMLALLAYVVKRLQLWEEDALLYSFGDNVKDESGVVYTSIPRVTDVDQIDHHLVLLETEEQVDHFVQHLHIVLDQRADKRLYLHDPNPEQAFNNTSKVYEMRTTPSDTRENIIVARIIFQSYFKGIHRDLVQSYALSTTMHPLTEKVVTMDNVIGDSTKSKFQCFSIPLESATTVVQSLHQVLRNETFVLLPRNETIIVVDEAHCLTYFHGRPLEDQKIAILWCLMIRLKRSRVPPVARPSSSLHVRFAVDAPSVTFTNVPQKILMLTGTPLFHRYNVLPFFRLASLLVDVSRTYYYQAYPNWIPQTHAIKKLAATQQNGENSAISYFRAPHPTNPRIHIIKLQMQQMFLQIHTGMVSYFTLRNDATKFPRTQLLCSDSSDGTKQCIFESTNGTLRGPIPVTHGSISITRGLTRVIIKGASSEEDAIPGKNKTILATILSTYNNNHFIFCEKTDRAVDFLNDPATQQYMHPFSEWILYQIVLLVYLYGDKTIKYPHEWPERWYALPANILADIIWHATLSITLPQDQELIKQQLGQRSELLLLNATPIPVMEYMCRVYGTQSFICTHRLFEQDVNMNVINDSAVIKRGEARNLAMNITRADNFADAYRVFGQFEEVFRMQTTNKLKVVFTAEAGIPKQHTKAALPLPSFSLPIILNANTGKPRISHGNPLDTNFTTFFISRALAIYNSSFNVQKRMVAIIGDIRSSTSVQFRNTNYTHYYDPPSSLALKDQVDGRTARACMFDDQNTEKWWNMNFAYEHEGYTYDMTTELPSQLLELLQIGAMDRFYFHHFNTGTYAAPDVLRSATTNKHKRAIYIDLQRRYIRIVHGAPLRDTVFGLSDNNLSDDMYQQLIAETTWQQTGEVLKGYSTSIDLYLNAYLRDVDKFTISMSPEHTRQSLESIGYILRARLVGVSAFAWRAAVSELEKKMRLLTRADAIALRDFITKLPDDVEHLNDHHVAALLDIYGDNLKNLKIAKDEAIEGRRTLTNSLLSAPRMQS